MSMEHQGTLTLESSRLLLRKFTLDDVELAFNNWQGDQEVTKFLRWQAHVDQTVTRQVISDWIAQYQKADFYQWAIVLRSIAEPIGSISVVDKEEKTAKLHIGYCIGRNWWRQGLTSEALATVIHFLFTKVKANRIESIHDPANPNSGKVMQKCGLGYEGRLRQADWSNRGIVDADIYAILAEDYFKVDG